MKQISENLIIGYDKEGTGIEAERLQKWAYNQLAIAPYLFKVCKHMLGLLESGKKDLNKEWMEILKQAILKDEEKNKDQ